MRTEHLDNKINELEALRSRGELTYMGGEMLSEFNEIKLALTIPVVSQSVAKEWGEFIIRCDREGRPLLLLEDYIEQYCG